MTDSDAKEWVTVKVPREIRDDAREDKRTYGDIMQAGLEVGKDSNRVPNPDELSIPSSVDSNVSDDVREQLDRIESAAKEATNAAQNAEKAAEDLRGSH